MPSAAVAAAPPTAVSTQHAGKGQGKVQDPQAQPPWWRQGPEVRSEPQEVQDCGVRVFRRLTRFHRASARFRTLTDHEPSGGSETVQGLVGTSPC